MAGQPRVDDGHAVFGVDEVGRHDAVSEAVQVRTHPRREPAEPARALRAYEFGAARLADALDSRLD